MRRALLLTAVILPVALPLCGYAQATGTCAAPPTMPLQAGGALVVESRSAEIEVLGTDRDDVRVVCRLKDSNSAANIKVLFSKAGSAATLRLKGGPKNNVHIRIELPQRTDINLHATAGEWKIRHVVGNKDIRLSFGDIDVAPVTTDDYGSVQASTRIGEVHVPGKGVTKEEFLQSFTKNASPGKYRLQAHVTTGDIDLRNAPDPTENP